MTEDRFSAGSRYASVPWATYQRSDGTDVAYLRRRLVPRGRGPLLGEHSVVEGERPDSVAAIRLGDAESYWRLCDSNGVLHPRELTSEVGRRLRIELPRTDSAALPVTLPPGYPGGGSV